MTESLDLDHRPVLIILKHFHTLKAAEHEVVERLSQSTRDLGWEPRIINVDGDFKISDIAKCEAGADLVLDIHYEYPKFLKPRSIGAVWTPTSFMKEWDLAYVWENQLSHDALVHTDSALVSNLLSQYRPQEDFGILNHSLPSSWLEWVNKGTRKETPKAFYAGINWTKLSGRPGRHHEFFKLLDNRNVLDLYGPRKIGQVTPWKGFASYRGEIPFDGKSLLLKARASGISLVVSAQQHLDEGMISSRLFEGLFAGNAIISDRHPFIEKHLGKHARYLDFEKGDKYAASQLSEYVEEFHSDRTLLSELQRVSQEIFVEKFDLTEQLRKILSRKSLHAKKIEDLDALVLGSSTTGILEKLENLNFRRVEFTNNQIVDLQDLIELAQSLDFKKFCVFTADTDFLDNFSDRITLLLKKIESDETNIGVLSTVALLQGPKLFAPVIVPSAKSLPLNGLLIDISKISANPSVHVDFIPSLRVTDYRDIRYVSKFVSPFDFLLNRLNNLPLIELGEESLRQVVLSGLAALSAVAVSDVAEDIRRLPRGRKRAATYALLASLPFVRPLVVLSKWVLRKKNQ